MSNPDSSFFVFDTHTAAEDAIRTLGQSGFDIKKLSLVGKGYHSEEKPMGALEGAVVVGGLSALGAALMQIGVPKDQVIKYEAALKVDKFLLVVHGSAEDQEKARSVLAMTKTPVTA